MVLNAISEEIADLKTLTKQWFHTKEEDETNFQTWLSENITHENGYIYIGDNE